MVYELDELANSVLANSSCKDLNSLAVFKLISGKKPIEHNGKSIFFNSTEGVKIDLGSVPEFIAFNNKKLVDCQATNCTDDKTDYLSMMG